MSSTLPSYVRLANEIAAQFAHRAPADAAAAIANHMKIVWDPRMKKALIAHVEAGADDLDPVAALAAQQLAAATAAATGTGTGTATTRRAP